MDIFLKRYSWTLNLAVVILAGVVAGRTVSALSAVHLNEPPRLETSKDDTPRAVHTVSATISAEGLAGIFGAKLPSDEPEVEEEPEEIDLGDNIPSTLNATLVATIEANPERYSLSLITDNSSRNTAVYGIGDNLMGAEVIRIERRRVLINNDGRTEYLEMDEEDNGEEPSVAVRSTQRSAAARARRAPPSRSSSSSSSELSEQIQRTGDNEYTIAQEALDGTMSNLNEIATQARIVPAFEDGEAQGFKLFSIRPGSVYAEIGIQNGDVVRSINGFEINSPDRALEVYQRLRDSQRVEVEIVRRGQTIRKVYNID